VEKQRDGKSAFTSLSHASTSENLLTVLILYLMHVFLIFFFDLGLYESLGHLNLLAAASQRYLTTTKINYMIFHSLFIL
jgi:hypothetical protein